MSRAVRIVADVQLLPSKFPCLAQDFLVEGVPGCVKASLQGSISLRHARRRARRGHPGKRSRNPAWRDGAEGRARFFPGQEQIGAARAASTAAA